MGRIARWLSSKIETYITGIIESRLNERIQSILYGPSGDDSPPLSEDRVLLVSIDGEGKHVITGVICKSQGAEPGEKKLYSRDSNGDIQGYIYIKSDGIIEINGNADFAVAFNDLKSGFDTLVSNFNSHTHPTAPSGPVSPPSIPSTASIDSSKVSEVKFS